MEKEIFSTEAREKYLEKYMRIKEILKS